MRKFPSFLFIVLLYVLMFFYTTTKAPAIPPHPGARPLKVAVVVPASSTDQGWNQMGVDGLRELKDKWHLTIEVAENQGYGDIKPVLRDLARKGFDLIIAHASGYQTVTPEVAVERDVRVAVVENPAAVRPGLVSNYEGEAQKGAYLAGVLAAKMTRTNVVGCVTSAEVPDWNRMTVGFMEGLHSINPKINFLYNVIGEASYEDAIGGKRNTEAQIAAGADVIFGMGDGASFGIMKACEENRAKDGGKVWFIDVIGDKTGIDRKQILLASVLWNFDVVYEMMLIDIYSDRFGDDYRQTLENGGIELAVYKEIPSVARAAMKQAEEGIKNGRIKVSNIADTREMRSYMRRLFK
ncbi:MAG: BMP family protein [Spirochaetota bacterium]|nr:MAG: BMP family protein [Spirochaetota bacterium]